VFCSPINKWCIKCNDRHYLTSNGKCNPCPDDNCDACFEETEKKIDILIYISKQGVGIPLNETFVDNSTCNNTSPNGTNCSNFTNGTSDSMSNSTLVNTSSNSNLTNNVTNKTAPIIYCFYCKEGFAMTWKNAKCAVAPNCGPGYYFNQDYYSCKPCSQGCQACNSTSNCSQCVQRYYI
jgi:hypothetical protein